MQPPQKAAEIQPGEDEDLLEFREREAQLKSELEAGILSPADYKRLKEEAWNVYQNRTGRFDLDEDPGKLPT